MGLYKGLSSELHFPYEHLLRRFRYECYHECTVLLFLTQRGQTNFLLKIAVLRVNRVFSQLPPRERGIR